MVKRTPILQALRDEALTLAELDDRLDVSRSTIHRTTQTLCEKRVVRDSNGAFELTDWGAVVLDELVRFSARMEAVCKLESFLNAVEYDDVDVPAEHFEDVVITEPKPRQPHYCVNRILELIEDTTDLRLFTSVVSPFYVDAVCRKLRDGMDVEVILDAEAAEILLEEYSAGTTELVERGVLDLRVREHVPFELLLFDEKLGMTAHDAGVPQVFVETDSDDAYEWGASIYESYRRESTNITKVYERA